MIKKILSSSLIQFFCACFLVIVTLTSNAYPIKTTASLVVLPFTIDSSLLEIRNDFSDNLIQKLKNAGFNAIGTRYLSSVLKMDDCSSDECMKKIASIVGARYVVSGSFSGDSTSLVLSFKLHDLMESKQLIGLDRQLKGVSKALINIIDELTGLISQSLGGADILPVPANISSDSVPVDTSHKQPELVATDKHATDTSADTTIKSMSDTTPCQIDSMVQVDSALTVSDTSDTSDEKDILSDSTQSITGAEKMTFLNSDTVKTEQKISMSKPEHISATDFKSSTPVRSAIAPDYPGIQIPQVAERSSLVKPLPKSLNQQHFRGARLLLFGNTAIVGFIGGLIMNEQVKKGLSSEEKLYSIHLNADNEHIKSTYDNYTRQTEKTDKNSRYRNLLYAVCGASALGFSISIFF
ncbi:MAG TPA: hypothetical protein VHP36_10490 [Chitinispirillaceae bacterium]|nr:hypothetical protein [Chitinispirillaceae bacterium]